MGTRTDRMADAMKDGAERVPDVSTPAPEVLRASS
jgi:hypothetical protein